MPAPKPLTARWKSPAGKIVVRAIENALRAGTTADELRGYVRDLPGVDEVAPALDLRGIALPELIAVRRSDLTGARFDGVKLSWNFGGSILRHAVFDGAEGRNVDFGGSDLTEASFKSANLPGAVFFGARLIDANLEKIKMRGGQLKSADCRGANFTGADLRLVWAAEADLRGTNLSSANLVGASLGKVKWDEMTRGVGAELSWEGTPADLASHALAQGATLRSEKPDWEKTLVDATRAALQNENSKGELDPLLSRLAHARAELNRDPAFNWSAHAQQNATSAERLALQRAIRTAATNTGALLG